MSERHRGVEVGDDRAAHTILWLHGYTGSPDAFQKSAEKLAETFDAKVIIPLLPGHGTREENLPLHSFDDFLASARHYFFQALDRGKPLAIIGYSFGGHLALLLAAEKNPAALVIALTPYSLKFPWGIPGVAQVLNIFPFWGKHLTEEDVQLRQGTFYYPHLPGKSLSLIREGNSRVQKILKNIRSPILTAHNADDPLAATESGEEILAASGKNPDNMSIVIPHGRHTFFLGPYRDEAEYTVISFLKKHLQKETAAGL